MAGKILSISTALTAIFSVAVSCVYGQDAAPVPKESAVQLESTVGLNPQLKQAMMEEMNPPEVYALQTQMKQLSPPDQLALALHLLQESQTDGGLQQASLHVLLTQKENLDARTLFGALKHIDGPATNARGIPTFQGYNRSHIAPSTAKHLLAVNLIGQIDELDPTARREALAAIYDAGLQEKALVASNDPISLLPEQATAKDYTSVLIAIRQLSLSDQPTPGGEAEPVAKGKVLDLVEYLHKQLKQELPEFQGYRESELLPWTASVASQLAQATLIDSDQKATVLATQPDVE